MWKLHIAGEPMLNKKFLKVASGSMRSLHDGIWFTEQRLLGEKNPSYPIYVANVPKGHDFVETTPGDMIFLRFDDIFNMFYVRRLHNSCPPIRAQYGDGCLEREYHERRDTGPLLLS